jgi:AraC-like DNA-binding protein
MIAERHGISVRRLHVLFEHTGESVGSRIRGERLAAIRRDLADPRLTHRSIGRIAQAHGLVNPSAFTRLFHSIEGVTPSQFRDGALRRP